MSWYVLQCKQGQEQTIINSCSQHLSPYALDSAFTFRCERLWRVNGAWQVIQKDLFPGYVFLESRHPGKLTRELDEYRRIVRVMEDKGYLLSLYRDEEACLRKLCGENHLLKMSYGYKDKQNGVSHITKGPLIAMQNQITRIDWHRRYAQIEVLLLRQRAVVWAGIEFDKSKTA